MNNKQFLVNPATLHTITYIPSSSNHKKSNIPPAQHLPGQNRSHLSINLRDTHSPYSSSHLDNPRNYADSDYNTDSDGDNDSKNIQNDKKSTNLANSLPLCEPTTTSLTLILPSMFHEDCRDLLTSAGYLVVLHEVGSKDVDLMLISWEGDQTLMFEKVLHIINTLELFTQANVCDKSLCGKYPNESIVFAFPCSAFAQLNTLLSSSPLGRTWSQLCQPSCYDQIYQFHRTFTVRSEDIIDWIELYVSIKKNFIKKPPLSQLRFLFHHTFMDHTNVYNYNWFTHLVFIGNFPEKIKLTPRIFDGFFQFSANLYSYTTLQDLISLFDSLKVFHSACVDRCESPWDNGFCVYFTEREHALFKALPQYHISPFVHENNILSHLLDVYITIQEYQIIGEQPGFIQFIPFDHTLEFCRILSLIVHDIKVINEVSEAHNCDKAELLCNRDNLLDF